MSNPVYKYFIKILTLTLFIAFWPTNDSSAIKSRLDIGDYAPEINLPALNGQALKLSSLRGSLVLVNFWSTWCVACNVIKNPEYARLYNKHKAYSYGKANNFKMYSVAFDSDLSKWRERIKEAGLNWKTHVVDKESYYSPYWFRYNIRSIPSSFLLDESGKILAINMTYRQLDEELSRRKTGAKKPHAPSYTPPPSPVPATKPIPQYQPKPAPLTLPPPSASKGTEVVFKIQLGAFKNPNLNAYTNLTKYGKIQLENTSSGSKRVLLGTYNVLEIDDALANVKKSGYVGAFKVKRKTSEDKSYTPPQPKPKSSSPPAAQPTKPATTKPNIPIATIPDNMIQFNKTLFKIQLGVVRTPNLGKFAKLSDLGELHTEATPSGMYRLMLGRYEVEAQARAKLATTRQRGFLDAFLVKRTETIIASKTDPTNERVAVVEEEVMPELMDFVKFPVLKKTMLGQEAPEIALQNQDGAVIPLSAMRGKFTLLYLWATWSGEARQSNSEINKLYKSFKDKGLEVYSVAFDQRKERWKNAISEDQLAWKHHLIDTKALASPLLKAYNAELLPVLFLLDKEGNIIAENLSSEELNEKLKALLK